MGKSFGEVVRLYMDEQGITQSELARRMGTGRQTINNMLRDNRRGPTLVTAIAVAEAFGALIDAIKKAYADLQALN